MSASPDLTSLLRAWWRLKSLPRVGNIALNSLREQLACPSDLLQCTADDLVAFGLRQELAHRWLTDASLDNGFAELEHWCARPSCGVLLAGVDPYPPALACLRDAPTFLFYQGDTRVLSAPCVAMVGSRNPTPYGQHWAFDTAAHLAANGVSVVSGLAIGIDGQAHLGALQRGKTIAVLGSGLNCVYPKQHQRMAVDIVHQGGLLLSEFTPETTPQARHFPSRNRIVSGISQGVVVVEAALKSGSLITARLAADQGRDVFALPGAVNNPLSRGCHALIRDGAQLVECAEDIAQALNVSTQVSAIHDEIPDTDLPAPLKLVLAQIDFGHTSVDAIAVRAQMDMSTLMPQLLQLELLGFVQQQMGGFVRVR